MPTQLKVVWESVPIPIKLILDNDPRTAAICAYALALLYSKRECENFETLVAQVAKWSFNRDVEGWQQDADRRVIRSILIDKLHLKAKSLFSQIEVPAPSVSSKTKQNVKPSPELPIDSDFLSSLKVRYTGLGVDITSQYRKASVWYQSKGKHLSRDGFVRWLDNASSENGKSNAARAVAVCATCNGERRTLSEYDGIACYIPCPDCASPS